MTRNHRITILIGAGVLATVILFLFPPIAQDPDYHKLADHRLIAGIPNFGDVVSNAGFLLVGILGLWQVGCIRSDPSRLVDRKEILPIIVIFSGAVLIFVGSVYYHWSPSNATLLWDRLPMTLSFMGIFSMIIVERISLKAGIVFLGPLLLTGVGSVIYWHITEQGGEGDLRPYALVQFLPQLLVPLMLLLFPARYTRARYIRYRKAVEPVDLEYSI